MRRALIHDSHVRVAAATPGRASRRPPRWRLARLLLNRCAGVAGLATLLSSMPACIIPVAPDFQDPVSSPEVAPWIHDPVPVFNSSVSVDPKHPGVITVQVTDPNIGDQLYQRWIVNFPETNPTLQTVTVLDSTISRGDLPTGVAETTVHCGDSWTLNPAEQQIELIVADGPFADTSQHDEVGDPSTERAYASWNLFFQCPSDSTGTSP